MHLDDDTYLIGDPHFGIDFDKRGTPLHRRGERQAMQLTQFKEELRKGAMMNVMVGDLLDKPFVDIILIHEIADAYEEAATEEPEKHWVLMAGNHDLSRQVRNEQTGELVRGSFHALARMLKHLENVTVLFEPTVIGDIVFLPWQWGVTTEQQVASLPETLPERAIGHWDLMDFGGSLDHMAPVKALKEKGVTTFYSGHIHIAGCYPVETSLVHCTGSMQPYTHGEDPSGNFYRTLTLDELESIDDDQLTNVNVRLRLQPGEVAPELNCLSLIVLKDSQSESFELDSLDLSDLDINTVLQQQFLELEVPPKVVVFVQEKIGAIN